jgi:peroxin-5
LIKINRYPYQNMSSAKNLFEAECGQPNALVRIGRQMFQDAGNAGRGRTLLGPLQPTIRQEDEFTQEYLAQFGGANRQAPASFSMHGLLAEVNRLDRRLDHGVPSSAANDWTREYTNSAASTISAPDWANEYLRHANVTGGPSQMFDDVWQHSSAQPVELKWSAEYLNDAETMASMDVNAGATSMLNGIPDDAQLWDTEFMQFMKKVDQGDIRIDGDRAVDTGASTSEKQLAQGETNFWDKLESDWDDLSRNSDSHRWLAEYDDMTSLYRTYNLTEDNPYANVDDPLSLGKRFLNDGDLANAVLCFEAAVQRQSDSSESWLYLSRAQAENEQETRAIAAANKCLELDPENLDALATLSTAYANESLYDSSCRALAQWLAAHPKYKTFAPLDVVDNKRRPLISSFMGQDIFRSVESAFLQAAQSDGTVDPDLQNCFGVLYNLTGDMNRAVDCFQTALMIRPDDARLWNRLGATLANGSRSAEAVAAYRKALELYPGFVRARYNLGISCLNLQAHREAIDHFLSALSLQMRGVGPSDQRMMSDGIWGTLRVAIFGLRRDDWLALVDNRDFDGLKRTFGPTTVDFTPPSDTSENMHSEPFAS